MRKIAIQGGYGAFHEIAAKHYFVDEPIEIIPQDTFNELFDSMDNGDVHLGITAIENSIAGSILPNYNLLQKSSMHIIGEIYLRIKQNLVALPGEKIDELKEVHSHPMAILQCKNYFDQHKHIKVIESIDTALSAKYISDNQLKNTGAIASSLAANQYGLEILAESIETNKNNYTRFLILGNQDDSDGLKIKNKSSIYFSLDNKIGGLSKILTTLSFYHINLTKIQSLPIIGKDWQYLFYVDILIEDRELYKKAIEAITPFTGELGILGEYAQGKSILEENDITKKNT